MAIAGYLFQREKRPLKGLLAAEKAMMCYLVLTLLMVLFFYTKLHSPEAMITGRLRIVVTTAALWGVYRMHPCRFNRLMRVLLQIALLSWWYPDTYELNCLLPNLDHVFAGIEQQLFGCQPALLFCEKVGSPVFSELMHLGYASYYPLIAVVCFYYFFARYEEFSRVAFIIVASFFVYYVLFLLLPVTGPQYYYHAVGPDKIAAGIFPNLGDYFVSHQEAMPIPGYAKGVFYHLVAMAHAAGERPTAAFPSSHVGVTTILLILAWRTRSRGLVLTVLPLYVLMCFATVYIRAHYAIDVIGGWISAVVIYLLLSCVAARNKI